MYSGNQSAIRGRGGFMNSARDNYSRQIQPPQPPRPPQHSVSHYSQSHYSNEVSQRYQPMGSTENAPRMNPDDPNCYDGLRAVMGNSWTPQDIVTNWGSSYNSNSSNSSAVDTRSDPFQYRGSIPSQVSNFNNSRYFSHSSNYQQSTVHRSILKNRSSEDFGTRREQNYNNNCQELALAPAPDLNNAEEEDSFLYGNGSDKVIPSRPFPVNPQLTTVEARPLLMLQPSLPPSEEVRRSSPSPPEPPPPPPIPPPAPTPPQPSVASQPPPKERDSSSERLMSHSYNSHSPSPHFSKPPEPSQSNVPITISQLPRIPKIASQKSTNSDVCSEEKNESDEQSMNDEKAEEIQKLTHERDKLGQQLVSLKALLEKTIKKEADLLRNRQQKTGSKDPQVVENQKLMADVKKRIETVHDKQTELTKKIYRLRGDSQKDETPTEQQQAASSGASFCAVSNRRLEDEEEEDSDSRFVYTDAGNHLCEHCDEIVPKIKPYFEHLHTKEHWKKFSGEEEPWKPKNPKPKQPPSSDQISAPIKGSQFLIPVKGFFCNLCSVFMGNANHAEDHLKTARHNRAYTRYTLLNPQYEHKHNSDKGKALSRKQQEERKRQKEEQDKEEREKEKLRKKQEEESKRKEKAERLKEERRRKDDDRKENIKDKDRQRERERDRERRRSRSRDRDRERKRVLDSSPESSPLPTRDSSPEMPVYGPHFPFNDAKLVMKTIVNISERDYRRAYKANLKAILKQNKKKKMENASSSAPIISQTIITPVFNDEECDLDTGELLAQITKKCDDFDAMKQEDDYVLLNDQKEERSVSSEERNENSTPKSENNNEDDLNFEININYSQAKSTSVQKGLVVMKQIIFDDDFMETEKETDDANDIAGPINNASDNEDQPIVNNVMFPTLDLNDLTKSPPYATSFNTSDDMLNHMDYS